MNISYKVLRNSGLSQLRKDLAGFMLEFPYIFLAGLIPPFSVVKDLCASSPAHWGASNRVQWKKFQLSETDYKGAVSVLVKRNNFRLEDIPEHIDTAYKWYVWQYEKMYGVPYGELKKMMDRELSLMDAINKKQDDLERQSLQMELLDISDSIQKFIDLYRSKV